MSRSRTNSSLIAFAGLLTVSSVHAYTSVPAIVAGYVADSVGSFDGQPDLACTGGIGALQTPCILVPVPSQDSNIQQSRAVEIVVQHSTDPSGYQFEYRGIVEFDLTGQVSGPGAVWMLTLFDVNRTWVSDVQVFGYSDADGQINLSDWGAGTLLTTTYLANNGISAALVTDFVANAINTGATQVGFALRSTSDIAIFPEQPNIYWANGNDGPRLLDVGAVPLPPGLGLFASGLAILAARRHTRRG